MTKRQMKQAPKKASPLDDDEMIDSVSDDPVGDHFQNQDDAKQAIVVCFKVVSRLVGGHNGRQLLADFLKALPPPKKGRAPGRNWNSPYDRDLMLAYWSAPKRQGIRAAIAIGVGKRYRRKNPDTVRKNLLRLRKEWDELSPAARQWIVEGWVEPPQSQRSIAETFAEAVVTARDPQKRP